MTKDEFNALAGEWEKKTKFLSSSRTIMNHPACRKIAAAGKDVVPWCLERLRNNPNLHWCFLLREITGEDPSPKPDKIGDSEFFAYDVLATVQAWLAWGDK